jgi:NADPH:quinone reductase-like Zn-dependent oxidoreductase
MHREPGHDTVTRALWYVAPGQAILRAEATPAPGSGEVLVQTRYSALSRGTESLVFQGAVPETEHRRMRAPFQAGAFPFPVKYGYAAAGTVTVGPHDLLGREVFALHPHQSAFVVPIEAVIALPSGLPLRRAVLAANMETALNALWDAAVLPGSRVAVIGAGTVGALTAYLAGHVAGAEVTMVDVRPERAGIASALGVEFASPREAPANCDLVFHASATPEGLATALTAAGDEGTVVELSWYGDRAVTAAFGGAFHSRRLRLLASQVGSVAPAMRARWPHRRRLAKAIALLIDPRLDSVLEPDVSFEDLPTALPALLGPGSAAMCQVVAYS